MDLDFIKNRLPSDHGFIDSDITSELVANDNNKYYTLAALYERLAANDRYASESIGNHSYSNPLLMDRAAFWRNYTPINATGVTGSTITFVPATGLAFTNVPLSFGTELG